MPGLRNICISTPSRRWVGDTNFMTVVSSETRVLPEMLAESWRRLREALVSDEKKTGPPRSSGVAVPSSLEVVDSRRTKLDSSFDCNGRPDSLWICCASDLRDVDAGQLEKNNHYERNVISPCIGAARLPFP